MQCLGSAKYTFFEKCLKKMLDIFSNLFFYLKVQSFRLIIENNFIQMAASAGHALAYTMAQIFKHIIDCVQLYFIKGTPQIIVQRCEITAPTWPNDISSAADNAIFKNKAQNTECSFSCVARSAVLLKPNVANIPLFNFCEQKFIQHNE